MSVKKVNVSLPETNYQVHIGRDCLATSIAEVLGASPTKPQRALIVVITNPTVHNLHGQSVLNALQPFAERIEVLSLPDGEQHKTPQTAIALCEQLLNLNANRETLIVAAGGGVVGDMAGFVAAIFMRGVEVLQIPTTLLACIDSSIGGKTGVNLPLGKNSVGAFKQPIGVVADLSLLNTLPLREWRAGLFELIKHGIIRDANLLAFLQQHQDQFNQRDASFWPEAIQRSCSVKAEVVALDEKEGGLRAILNFGHTLAHILESHTHYVQCLHGEAVGIGMCFAGFVSQRLAMLAQSEWQSLQDLLAPIIRPITLAPLEQNAFETLLLHDKKSSHDGVKFICLNQLGAASIRPATSATLLWESFQDFRQQHPSWLPNQA